MADEDVAPAGWYGDPFGRHQRRYFDRKWTDRVSDEGVESADPASPMQPLTVAISSPSAHSQPNPALLLRQGLPAERRFRRFVLWFTAMVLSALVIVFVGMSVTSAHGRVPAGWADALGVVVGLIFLGGAFTWGYRFWTLRPNRTPVAPNRESRPPAA